MLKFREVYNAQGCLEKIQTCHRGKFLLAIPELNKGSAFTKDEREKFGLMGKLPYYVESMQEQLLHYYAQYQQAGSDLEKNQFLNKLKLHNNIVFYALVKKHLPEMLPIVYTPTIADAVENYSFQFDLPRGLHFSYPNKGRLYEVLDNISFPEVDLIIITDGEGVLGIGDWGVGGMDICVGKLMVYSLCGGINPRRVLPIQLDVGTNNEKLLNDPFYLGWRHKRISGKDYDDFVAEAVSVIHNKYPKVYLHWEDFGRDNARKNLERYRHSMTTFNDDIQGTGATAAACVLAGVKSIGSDITQQQVVVFGAGSAGVGIADQIVNTMIQAGLTVEQARRRLWLVDREGLLIKGKSTPLFFQEPYLHDPEDLAALDINSTQLVDLLAVVTKVKPTILIGCSTAAGAFSEDIVKTMAAVVDYPLIFPLSNPTIKSEAIPEDLIQWTNGKAIVATGSPFSAVTFKGEKRRISQCNNAYVFPGLGLGVIASEATRVSDGMIAAACYALSECSPALKSHGHPLLPPIEDIDQVSMKIALAVALQAREESLAGIAADVDLEERVRQLFWRPQYVPYESVEVL